MSDQELEYSNEEINEIWSNLKSAEHELEEFESKDSERKKEIIIRIRDNVDVLVQAKKIPIRRNQISSYVLNILESKGISYSKGHWYELFKDYQKRNHSESPKGESSHEHDFEVIADTPNGKWESCQCGTNRINGIIQIDQDAENLEAAKKISIREIEEPEGIEFEYLKMVKELFSQNVRAIDMIMQKCTLDITSIKKQTIEKEGRKAPQIDYDKLLANTTKLVNKRRDVTREELKKIRESDIAEKKKSITQILNAVKKLNDRTKITNYEKAMAKIMIEKFDYSKGDIASILNITTKHIKNNILKLNSDNPNDQDTMLEQLDFLSRCPGCGLGIADILDEQYAEFLKGNSIEDDDFKLESFPFPPFAEQVVELKQEIRKKNILIKKLKAK